MLNQTLNYSNAQIHYYITEEHEDKDTILMLHPAFADHHLFEDQVSYFHDDYRICLIDMPGHGNTVCKGSSVTLKDVPRILDTILSKHRISHVHILGVSMGTLAAQAFADRYPDRVKSLTMVGGYSLHKANEAILKRQKREAFKWLLYMLLPFHKFRSHVAQVSCYSDRGRELFIRGLQKFTRRSFTAMAGMNAWFVNTNFAKTNSPVTYPLLIVTGEHDQNLIKDASFALHQLESGSQFVLLPGAGHCANADAPREFNAMYKEFLSRLL